MPANSLVVRIPFQGFYETIIAEDIDQQIDYYDFEWEAVNYGATYAGVAKEYAEEWLHQSGFEGKYSAMVSPREYNFDTDAILIEFTEKGLWDIKRMTLAEEGGFAKWVEENCRSSPGFISYLYSDLSDWGEWAEKEYYAALTYLSSIGHPDEDDIRETLNANGRIDIILTSENK